MLFASITGDHEASQKYLEQDFENGIQYLLQFFKFIYKQGTAYWTWEQCDFSAVLLRILGDDTKGKCVGFSDSVDNL